MDQVFECDQLWIDAQIATMVQNDYPYGMIEQGAIAVRAGRIVWIGPQTGLPKDIFKNTKEVISLQNHWVTPALIDCHTHLVYGGNRVHEFEARLKGATYEDILKQGGGIFSSVRATREASEETLYLTAKKRLQRLMQEGVLTFEIKSGYGLTFDSEIKMLKVAKRLAAELPITVQTTCLSAHVVSDQYRDRADDYVNDICNQWIPKLQQLQLIDAVDVFCEKIAFSVSQAERIFKVAQQAGLKIKVHAEQLSHTGISEMAAKYGASSADHLEWAEEQDIKAMKAARMVAVCLPGAYYFLRETKKPPIDLLRQYQVPIAIATDSNPGTSPAQSLLLMGNMACILWKLTPEEALSGMTIHAAQALGYQDSLGSLEVGKMADFVVWDIAHPAELMYGLGANPCVRRVKSGMTV